MSMTKSNYELIAEVFKDFADTSIGEQAKEIAVVLSYDLQRDNPKFDRQRFLKACGVQE